MIVCKPVVLLAPGRRIRIYTRFIFFPRLRLSWWRGCWALVSTNRETLATTPEAVVIVVHVISKEQPRVFASCLVA
jgi:hypothetical protein